MTRANREPSAVRLEPWSEGDLPLLVGLLGDPEMTTHLGGPETPAQLARRHARYVAIERSPDSRVGRVFKVVDARSGEGAGWVGYWQSVEGGARVYEMGWSVLKAFQGRGIASAAAREVLALVRAVGVHRYMHAHPAVDNAASNAVCRKLGFELLGQETIDYPPGRKMLANDWRYDLRPEAG